MLWYFVIGTLAAFGAYCAIWTLLGWLLPKAEGCAIVFWKPPEEESLARLKWLRDMGFLDLPVIVIGRESPCPETENCSREELLSGLERERKQVHGTGNGDHTGRHQRGGVSEL